MRLSNKRFTSRKLSEYTDSELSSDDDYDLYDYQIMQFIKRGRQPVNRTVRIVSKLWIKQLKGKIKAQYMEEPHSEEDKFLIRELLRLKSPAPEDWPWYTVISVGHGRMYYILLYIPLC